MIKAASGNHFRSIVDACSVVEGNTNIDAIAMNETISIRLGTRLSPRDCGLFRAYVIDCAKLGGRESLSKHSQAEAFTDMHGAVPLALTISSFSKAAGFQANVHPVQNLFQCSPFQDSTKQLWHVL